MVDTCKRATTTRHSETDSPPTTYTDLIGSAPTSHDYPFPPTMPHAEHPSLLSFEGCFQARTKLRNVAHRATVLKTIPTGTIRDHLDG